MKGVTIADALVRVGDNGRTTLVISNPSMAPVVLEEGESM